MRDDGNARGRGDAAGDVPPYRFASPWWALAALLAGLLLTAANAEEPLPRTPLPTRPTASDPFAP